MSGAAEGSTVPTLAYAILALLAREPLTGYQIGRLLRDPIGLFWQARHSQIYPVLARLERLGWAESTEVPGPGPRPKKHYRPSRAGLDALRTWVSRPSTRRGRDELLLRVYASWIAGGPATCAFLVEAEAQHRQQLAVYLERRAAVRARGGPGQPGTAEFADYATLRRGIGYERGRLAWVRWLIGQLGQVDGSEAGVAVGRRCSRRPGVALDSEPP
jgi:DNA-binding PadR family transcriptional regulator